MQDKAPIIEIKNLTKNFGNLQVLNDITETKEMLHDSEYPTSEQYMEVANEELVNERNHRWIPVIDKNVHQGSCLIAVGALHLPGEIGLISLLRKEGYTLTPVDIHSR